MTDRLTTIEIRTAILTGGFTHADLEEIRTALKDARGLADALLKAQLKVGDEVEFNDSVRPGYLEGIRATITKINRTRVTVSLNEPAGKFRADSPITTPVSIIDLVVVGAEAGNYAIPIVDVPIAKENA